MLLMWFAATPAIAEEANFLSLTYSPWTKICLGDICFIGRDGRSNVDCDPVVAAVLIEQNGGKEKTLRVTLPRGLAWSVVFASSSIRATQSSGPM